MPTAEPPPKLLPDLRVRRLVRYVLETHERIEAEALGVATYSPEERAALVAERTSLMRRLARAAGHLAIETPFSRKVVELVEAHEAWRLTAEGSADERRQADHFAVALIAVRDEMRHGSRPPPPMAGGP